jgi:hypothetical protein
VALMSSENKVKAGSNAIIFVVAAIVALIFLNVIGNRFFKRVDFTQDRIYTLNQASKDLVAKLPDRMTVKAFISNDLQPPFSQTAQYVRDLLDEYKNASKGKFVWEAVDPGNDPKAPATSAWRCSTRDRSSRSPRSTRRRGSSSTSTSSSSR